MCRKLLDMRRVLSKLFCRPRIDSRWLFLLRQISSSHRTKSFDSWLLRRDCRNLQRSISNFHNSCISSWNMSILQTHFAEDIFGWCLWEAFQVYQNQDWETLERLSAPEHSLAGHQKTWNWSKKIIPPVYFWIRNKRFIPVHMYFITSSSFPWCHAFFNQSND